MGVITLNFVFAQTPSDKVLVEWGEQQKASKKSTVNNIVGFDDVGGVYVQKVEYKKMGLVRIVTIEHFDENMNFINSGVVGDAGIVFPHCAHQRIHHLIFHLVGEVTVGPWFVIASPAIV